MAFKGTINFRGLELPAAYVRMGYAPQVFKKERRVHLIFDLYASEEAYKAGNDPLLARYLTVDFWADNSKELENRQSALVGPERGKHLNLYKADVAQMWGETVEGGKEMPNNVFAQGYVLAKTLNEFKELEDK